MTEPCYFRVINIMLLAGCLFLCSCRQESVEKDKIQSAITSDPAGVEKRQDPFKREHPFLLTDSKTFAAAKKKAKKYLWAKKQLEKIIRRADGILTETISIPSEGAQWPGHYVCKKCNIPLKHKDGRHVCPKCGKVYTGWPFDHVIYYRVNNRNFGNVRTLGLAYVFSGKEEYAKKAGKILLGYAAKYSTYKLHDIRNKKGCGARLYAQTLDEAVQIIAAVWGYDLIYNSPSLSDKDRRVIENQLFRPVAKTVRGNIKCRGNWQAWHNAAIAAIGFCVKDRELTDYAIKGLRFHLKESVGNDGFWHEGTPAYHYYALGAIQFVAEIAHFAGIDIYKEPALKAMYEAPIMYAFPDMTFPAVGDSDIGYSIKRYGAWYDLAYARFGDPKFLTLAHYGNRKSFFSLLWGIDELPPATKLAFESRNFRGLGISVLRQGCGEEQLYVHLDYNTPDRGHGHRDKLSIILHGLGRQLAPDPGRGYYLTKLHYGWYGQTFAHNTVCVDMKTHSPSAAIGTSTMFNSRKDFAIAQARCDTAYSGVKMKRTVALTGRYLIDVFTVASDREHTYDWVYHNFGKLVPALPVSPLKEKLGEKNGYQYMKDITRAATGKTWRADFKQDNANVRLTMLGATGTELYFGIGIANKPPQPCPMLVARRKGKSTTFISIIEPYEKTPSVTGVRILPVTGDKNAIAIEITRGGKKDMFMVAEIPGLQRRFGGITTHSRACFAPNAVDGNTATFFNVE